MRPHWRNHGNQVLVAKFFQSCIFKKKVLIIFYHWIYYIWLNIIFPKLLLLSTKSRFFSD